MAKFAKGDPKRGGRTVGTPNKASLEIKEAARQHGPTMIKLFAAMANNPKKPDAIRLQAGKELLDRGYGRAVQPVGGDPDEPLVVIVRRFGDEPQPDYEAIARDAKGPLERSTPSEGDDDA